MVVTNGKEVLPASIGFDLGTVFKPSNTILMYLASWFMDLQQEFVYSGDGGFVDITGATRRIGIDASLRNEPIKSLFIDVDANYAHGRYRNDPKGQDFIPLAPLWSATGGITYKNTIGLNGGLRCRMLSNRPAIEDNSLTANGYIIADGVLNYTKSKYEIGLKINNIFNTKWKETQFASETKFQNESKSVTKICFTPGTKFMATLIISYFLDN